LSRPAREPARDLALAEAVGRELTLVCAPAGFGKTALLGFWAYRGRRPVAWLSHEGDNDPARFWRYVAAALDQVCEGVGGQVAALLGANRRHGWRRW
jgi:LuxR family maltose regulon positive regulatory protein